MRIIGFHSGHDCAYCVLEDGIPIIHEEYERISRVKEGNGDALDLYFNRSHKEDDSIFAHVYHHPGGVKGLFPDSWFKMNEQIRKNNGTFIEPGHHQSHAANAFFTSDYDEALIFTFDAGGWDLNRNGECSSLPTGHVTVATTTVWRGKENKITDEKIYSFSDLNIGGVWHGLLEPVFGLSNGPPKGNQAGTLMAMASIGDGSKYYDLIYNNFHPNALDYAYLKQEHDSSEQAKYDIARALQEATEQKIKNLISEYIKPEDKNLCFAGGVALNSVALGKVFEWFPQVENIYVPPAPYDAGLAIGAAQFTYHQLLNFPRVKESKNASAYLGRTYSKEDITSTLQKNESTNSYEDSSLEQLIELLLEGKVVSVFSGGSESGRRALGNRSILADPRRTDMKDIINEKVKHRQWFRPFAPSILAEEVKNWFVRDVKSEYMSVVIPFKEEVRDRVPAVVHLDGTGRLQTVTAETNPWYYNFLKRWNEASGVPIILNTSFNDREPIVETPQDAVNCFNKTNIDNLYFVDASIMVSKR